MWSPATASNGGGRPPWPSARVASPSDRPRSPGAPACSRCPRPRRRPLASSDPATWPCDPSEFCIHRDNQDRGAHSSLADGASNLGVLDGQAVDLSSPVRDQVGSVAEC
ncbi:hypothetical protein [Streptomyces sp. NPDC057616]|uniref:hypothetical protein n=1 Tax=Streptomyces sp. NPDC057616 TaxID=3346183 RepID=UPI0036ADBF21